MGVFHKILLVYRREVVVWAKRPLYMVGTVLALAFCTVFYITFLGAGVPSDVPIGVVDEDNSSVSRNFVSQLDITQIGETIHFETYSEARRELQRGNITGLIVIPEGMYRDLQGFRQPSFTFYVNGLYFLGGSLAYKGLLNMVNLTSGAVQRQVLRAKGYSDDAIMGIIKPVNVDVHQIGNPLMSYGAYLSTMMIPGVIQMIVVLMIIYSLGTELKYGGSRKLMEISGNSITVALAGKMLFYTIFFTALGCIIETLFFRWMNYPMSGRLMNMFWDMFLMIMASEAVGILIIGLLPVLRFSLSVGTLYSVLGLSLAGFTLPLEAMSGPFQALGSLFPLRHYYLIYVQEYMFDAGFAGWWKEAVYLLLFLIAPVFVLKRLKNAYILQDYSKN